ncbi:MAG: hypothetical protein AB7K86_19460 [Rhodospirillales bacterium]
MALKTITPEGLVNTNTTGFQYVPDVAGLASGGFVVVWDGPDANNNGIFGRVFGPGYTSTSFQFAVNASTNGSQVMPSAAGLANGGFAVAWTLIFNDGGVYARLFNAAGSPLTGDIQLNQYTTGQQEKVELAPLPNGSFVAAWESSGQDGDSDGIFVRRFSSSGSPLGNEMQVNTYFNSIQAYPDIASFGDGSFVVTWSSLNQVSSNSDYDIFAQRFNSSGNKFGPEFQVNTFTSSTQYDPSVATLNDGKFVFVWSSLGVDGSSYGITGRLYNADGSPATGEFQVNTYTTDVQFQPSVAALGDGGYIVTWTSFGQDGSSYGVYAQAYNPDGTREGAEFRVNTYTTSYQADSAVAHLNGTGVAVAWTSLDQVSDYDVFYKTYAEPVPVWRFYNNANGVHFFTLSTAERDNVIATLPSFRFEGSNFAGANGPFADTAPVYRFYNTQNGAHFYTINEAEKNNVIATLPTFLFEGPNYNAYTAPVDGTVPLYRFYNVLTGAHFFTPNEAERANVVATLPEFRFEGVAYYVDPING